MTATSKPTTSVLVAAAAVHVFLAQHPDLADLPIEWSFRAHDGITAYMRDQAGDATEPANRIAALLGAEVTGTEATLPDGTRYLPRYIKAELHGIPFFFSGHAPVGGAE